MQNFLLMFTFSILDLLQVLSKNQFGILVLTGQSPSILVAETWSQWLSLY